MRFLYKITIKKEGKEKCIENIDKLRKKWVDVVETLHTTK